MVREGQEGHLAYSSSLKDGRGVGVGRDSPGITHGALGLKSQGEQNYSVPFCHLLPQLVLIASGGQGLKSPWSDPASTHPWVVHSIFCAKGVFPDATCPRPGRRVPHSPARATRVKRATRGHQVPMQGPSEEMEPNPKPSLLLSQLPECQNQTLKEKENLLGGLFTP